VAIVAKVFSGMGSNYVGLSAEETAALKAAKEAEAGKKKEERSEGDQADLHKVYKKGEAQRIQTGGCKTVALWANLEYGEDGHECSH
jgi:hypothetical protein